MNLILMESVLMIFRQDQNKSCRKEKERRGGEGREGKEKGRKRKGKERNKKSTAHGRGPFSSERRDMHTLRCREWNALRDSVPMY